MKLRKKTLRTWTAILGTCAAAGMAPGKQEQAPFASPGLALSGRAYYVSATGNDNADGSLSHPLQSVKAASSLRLGPGDALYFQGGQTFNGTLHLDSCQGTSARPIRISSYGKGEATIFGGDSCGMILYQANYMDVEKLHLAGSGRKQGNTKEGLYMINCQHTDLDSINITGFQKAGLLVYSSTDILVNRVFAHENGAAGIEVEGSNGKKESRNIRFTNCQTNDNPGDPSNLTNHSGNGIVVGHCTNVLIDHCSATNNGWDMPRIGNGPVGIWCYEADSVLIQYCLAYKNKTSVGGADGGGFDLDGGTTNSIIQYCMSYGNQGSGYCIFQYWLASPWYHNVVRYNVTEDDGTVSDSRAGIYVWNSSDDSTQFYDCEVYNNTVYSSKEAALSYSEKSERKNFLFYNNIFVGGDSLIKGNPGADRFRNNNWWCLNGKGPAEGMGLNVDPHFKNPGGTTATSVSAIKACFDKYMLPAGSTLKGLGAPAIKNP